MTAGPALKLQRRAFHAVPPARGLVVDGDPQDLRFSADVLRQAGYSVAAAGSPGEALRELLLCRDPLDFVVVDYQLEGARWREVVAAARGLFPETKVVTTIDGDLRMTDRTERADAVLEKPFTAGELIETIEELLGVADAVAVAPRPGMDDGPLTVLSVGTQAADSRALARIFDAEGWLLRLATSVREGVGQQLTEPARVILIDGDTAGESWRTLMDRFGWLPYGPRVVVSSRLADERFWSAVLNLGGFDVVRLPFDRQEVRHVISHAWNSWSDEWLAGPHPAGLRQTRDGAR